MSLVLPAFAVRGYRTQLKVHCTLYCTPVQYCRKIEWSWVGPAEALVRLEQSPTFRALRPQAGHRPSSELCLYCTAPASAPTVQAEWPIATSTSKLLFTWPSDCSGLVYPHTVHHAEQDCPGLRTQYGSRHAVGGAHAIARSRPRLRGTVRRPDHAQAFSKLAIPISPTRPAESTTSITLCLPDP